MRRTRAIFSWSELVVAGDPLAVGIAVLLGLAILGLAVLAMRTGREPEPALLGSGRRSGDDPRLEPRRGGSR